tara:strand:- start:2415 stop:4400 length:1986 start_codon:yes stop_codon:yes gene_type:complete
MSNTTLIQLSEEASYDNDSQNKINGEWTNTLTEAGITLEEGDMLSIKNAFIDSAPSGNIFLKEDTVATIHFNYYMNNHDEWPTGVELPPNVLKKRAYTVADTVNGIPQPDGLNYIVCKKEGGGTTQTIAQIQFNDYGNGRTADDPYTYDFKVKGTDGKFLNCGEGSAPTGVRIEAQDMIKGKVFSAGFSLSTIQATNLYGTGSSVNYNMFHIERSDGHGMNPTDVVLVKGSFIHDSKLTPIIESVSMNFKAGYYSPSHIAHIMTDQLNRASSILNPNDEYETKLGVPSKLYTGLKNLITTNGGIVGGTSSIAFSAMDGSNVAEPLIRVDATGPAYDNFIGTNTFTFDYRDDLGIPRLAISQNHSPIYQKALTGIKKIQYKKGDGTAGNPERTMARFIGSSGGIIPVGATSTGVTDFWSLLGFDPGQFQPSSESKNVTLTLPNASTTNVFMNVFDMTTITDHITTTYTGLDVDVSKDDNDPKNYTSQFLRGQVSTGYTNGAWVPSLEPNLAAVNDYSLNKAELLPELEVPFNNANTFISTTNISPIFARYPVERALQQVNPYYLININVMKGLNVGSQSENTTAIQQKFSDISCVTGTYYNASSYTLSQPSDAIPYIHKGNPIPLNNIKVRILDKNKNNNKACLTKSHVFLILEKAEKPEKK